jgi:hypothetical protein
VDDIDRTFNVLKKLTFEQTYERMLIEANGNYGGFLVANRETWNIELYRPFHQKCIDCGWTVEEFNKRLNNDIK